MHICRSDCSMFIGCYHNSDSCIRCPCANQFLVNYAYHFFSINYVTQQAATYDGPRDIFFFIVSEISEKSANAVMGTKAVLLRSRDITVEQGLEHVATWNSGMLRSNDLMEAIKAFMEKRKPVFSKLWWSSSWAKIYMWTLATWEWKWDGRM